VEGKQEAEINAVQTKVGTGSSTPTALTALMGNGVGSSAWTEVLDEDAMSSDSATKLATQQSIKAYTDNSLTTHTAITNAHHALVTLTGAYNYLTLLGQQITLGQIDLTTDVTGVLPDANVANDITLTNITQITNRSHTSLSDIGSNSHSTIDTHLGSTSNPHSVTKAQVGLTNVDDVQQMPLSYLDTDTALTANSDVKVTSQKAIKTYADQLISTANALVYKGTIDCSANPNYPASDAGHLYVVSVAGKIGGASGITVDVGDMIICNTDSTASGDQATVGAYWNVIEKNIVGAVTGPASSTDNNVAFFDSTTGKVIKDSGLTLSGSNTGDQNDHGTLDGLSDDDHTQYVRTSQVTSPQIIGLTGSRLTKLWVTDITVTNAITGSITGNAGTVTTITGLAPDTATTQATQPNITSLGTLTALQVDNININLNTISSTAGTDLNITPLTGQQIVLDGTIVIDAGVVTGATSISSTAFVGALTGNADTVTNGVYTTNNLSVMSATTSAQLAGVISDETGTGALVFGTSPTFTTQLTSPLIIGGTATTADLTLQTTSGVGTTGADMHFLVGNNGATEAMTILNSGSVGIGTTGPTGTDNY
jgi:hypothetical protein